MNFSKVKGILLDIEGTTTSISFVKETLFPYVKKNLTEYVEKNWEKDEMQQVLKLLKEQSDADEKAGVEGLVPIKDDSKDSVVQNVLWQMELDRKTTGLKQLQGHMWREGYTSGDLKGHVYPEVAETLKTWEKSGKKLFVYSSGSVEAQKLLFGHSIAGDLAGLFSKFFDTLIGAKVEQKSYESIASDIELALDEILFLTDVVKEAESARAAGLQVAIVVREGNAPLDEEAKKDFTVIQTLDEIVFEPSSKRAKLAEEKTDEKKTSDEAKPENGDKMDIDAKAEESPEKLIETEPEKTQEAEKEKVEEVEAKPEEDKPTNGEKEVEKTEEEKPTNGEKEVEKPEEEKVEEVSSTNGEEKPTEAANGQEKPAEAANGEEKSVEATNGEEKPTNGEEKKETENGTAMEVDSTNGHSDEPVVAKTVPVEKEADAEAEPVVAKPVVDSSVPIEVAAE